MAVDIASDSRVEIGHEPLTYENRGSAADHSYVRDRWNAERHGDPSASERLRRHASEMDVVLDARNDAARRDLATSGIETESRAVNWAGGTGGYFAPPLWLIERFATAPRPQRVIGRLAPRFELPVGPQTINVPRLTTGTQVEARPLDAASPDRDPLDAGASSVVATISGTNDIPIQMIEQSPLGAPFDWVVFTDLQADYEYKLERQLLVGTGTGGQLAGIIPITPTVTYTSGTPKATDLFPFLGQIIAAVGNARGVPMQAWLMSSSRFGWLATSEDTATRPLILSDYSGSTFPIGGLAGFAVYLDDAIPRTLNAGTGYTGSTQDAIIAFRYDDLLLMESPPYLQDMRDVLSGSLEVRLQHRSYVAFLNRYPSSVATLGGTGLAVQAGY